MKRKSKKHAHSARKGKALSRKELKKVSGGIGGFADGYLIDEVEGRSQEWVRGVRKQA